jgi:hypothetical protein
VLKAERKVEVEIDKKSAVERGTKGVVRRDKSLAMSALSFLKELLYGHLRFTPKVYALTNTSLVWE